MSKRKKIEEKRGRIKNYFNNKNTIWSGGIIGGLYGLIASLFIILNLLDFQYLEKLKLLFFIFIPAYPIFITLSLFVMNFFDYNLFYILTSFLTIIFFVILGLIIGLIVSYNKTDKVKSIFIFTLLLFFIFLFASIFELIFSAFDHNPRFFLTYPLIFLLQALIYSGLNYEKLPLRLIFFLILLFYSYLLAKLIICILLMIKNLWMMKSKFRILRIVMILFILFNFSLLSAVTDSNNSNNGMMINVEVRNTKDLRVSFLLVAESNENISWFNSSVKDHVEFVNSTYPLAEGKFIPFTIDQRFEPNNFFNLTPLNVPERALLLINIYNTARLSGGDYNRVIGITPQNWLQSQGAGAGFTFPGFKSVILEMGFRHGTAHEMGHTVGFLCDEYNPVTWLAQNILLRCPNGDSNPPNFLLDSECSTFPGGCPTETFERLIPWLNKSNSKETVGMINFMGTADEENSRWISEDTYNYLLEQFTISEDLEETQNTILVSGLLDKNGSIIFNSFYILNETSVLNESNPNGNYSILIKSGASTLYTHKFEPLFQIENIGGETENTNITGFAVVLPFADNVTQIILKNFTTTLVEKDVSNNYPSVSFTTDFTNKNFNNSFTVNWSASDVDNDNLTYSVLISQDGGLNYTTIALDINNTNLTIDNSFLPNGSNFKLKVLATDSVKTSVALSNSNFSVQPDPHVELIFPTNETRLQTNNITFFYRTFVLNAYITNCSLFINGVRNLSNSTTIVQNGIMNFTQILGNGIYNWTIECGDSRGYIGETYIHELSVGNITPRIIDISFIEEQEFGKNVSINVTLAIPQNVSFVSLNITNPNGTLYSYNLTNASSNIWGINNFTDFVNGTYNFTFYIIYKNNISVSGSDSFMMVEEIINLRYCSILDKANTIYYLHKDVQAIATCFNITANNITLDGMDNVVYYAENSKGQGVYVRGYNNITINNIEIRMNNQTLTDNRGVYFVNSKYNKIANSTLVIKGANNTDVRNHGIEFRNTSNSQIINNDIATSNQKGYGIYLQAQIKEDSGNNILENNVITTYRNDEFGIYIQGVSGGDSVNSTIINNSVRTYGNNAYGLFIQSSVSTSIVDSNNIHNISILTSGSSSYAIRLLSSSNNIIKDSNISSFNENDTYTSGANNTFTNVTYVDEYGNLTRKWYLNVKINSTNGSNLNQANVSGFNKTNHYQFSELTDSNGEIIKKELIEYINNAGVKFYYTNYTVNVTKNGYDSSSQFVNLTTNKNVIFTLSSANDSFKYFIKDANGNAVAWFGNLGNIFLKGNCFSGGNCDIPGTNSFIIANATDNRVAFVNSSGDLCVEKGDCSDQSASCNPSRNAFIIRNSSNYNMSYIDFDGDLCLTGKLFPNSL